MAPLPSRPGLDVRDGSRMLNLNVLSGLQLGEIAVDRRNTGKSITLLTHIAVTYPLASRSRPIVICEKQIGSLILRDYWQRSFPGIPEPRWMSYRQFLAADGLRGDVYVDEPRPTWQMPRLIQHAHGCGRFAGGVSSVFLPQDA